MFLMRTQFPEELADQICCATFSSPMMRASLRTSSF
jgi:hypothetical protein